MISWKLVKDNRKNYYGIFIIIILCVTVVLASMMYINQSIQFTQNEITEKYGNVEAIIYVNNEEYDMLEKLDSIREIDNYVGQYRKIVNYNGMDVMLHIVDINQFNNINSVKTITGETIQIGSGIYLGNEEIWNEFINTDIEEISLSINENSYKFEVNGVLNENSYYEISSSYKLNLYIDQNEYEKIFGEVPYYDIFLIDVVGGSVEKVNEILQQFDDYSTKNVIDEIDLKSKDSNQSFIYAVSFIIIGLIAIVLGGLYNFSQSIMHENIRQISFFRTLGLSRNEATKLYWLQMIEIGSISEVAGVVAGIALGNIIYSLNYGFNYIIFPEIWMILLTLMVSIVLPYVFMQNEIRKIKNESAIKLLLEYKNEGHWSKEDYIKNYLISSLILILLFFVVMSLEKKLPNNLSIIISCLKIALIVSFFRNLGVILLHIISKYSNKILDKFPYLGLAFKNVGRNKKKVSSVIGILILVIAFDIGMYNVFYTIRWDTVEKVEQQYNADAYISNINLPKSDINIKIEQISNMEGIKHIETSNTRYLDIEGNRIEGYFLSAEEFESFLNLNDVNTGEKAVLSQKENYAVIGEGLAKKGNINVGDTITISDESSSFEVVVTSICNSCEYQGNIVYLNENFYNYPVNQINIIFDEEVSTGAAIENINSLYIKSDVFKPNIISKEQLKENYKINAIKGTMFIEIVLIVIVTAGVLMLLNQVYQIMNDRKREYYLLHTLGANYKEVNFIFIAENICILFMAIISSIFAGVMVTKNFVDIATYSSGITNVLTYYFDKSNLCRIILYIVFIYSIFLTSVLTTIKTRKLEIHKMNREV